MSRRIDAAGDLWSDMRRRKRSLKGAVIKLRRLAGA
jgi:hypothetical protein